MIGRARSPRAEILTLRVADQSVSAGIDVDAALVYPVDASLTLPPLGSYVFGRFVKGAVVARFSGIRISTTRLGGLWIRNIWCENTCNLQVNIGGAAAIDADLVALNPIALSYDFGNSRPFPADIAFVAGSAAAASGAFRITAAQGSAQVAGGALWLPGGDSGAFFELTNEAVNVVHTSQWTMFFGAVEGE